MKLSPITIYILGICLAFIILTFGLFNQAMPNWQEAANWANYVDQLQTEANKMNQAVQRRNQAIALVEGTASSWRQIVATRTPPADVNLGGINLAVNAWQLSVDTRKFRNNVQRLVNNQVRRGGVTVVNGPYVPGPNENDPVGGLLASYYNFGPIAFPVVIYDLGTVTVQGTYDQILRNVRSYATMPRFLAVADGLRIDGTSPALTGQYQLTVIGFIRGTQVAPPVPEAASTGAAGGGARGGPPMGFGAPGGFGPPGGFGGPAMGGRRGGGAAVGF